MTPVYWASTIEGGKVYEAIERAVLNFTTRNGYAPDTVQIRRGTVDDSLHGSEMGNPSVPDAVILTVELVGREMSAGMIRVYRKENKC